MRFEELFMHKKDARLYALVLSLFIIATIVYSMYFDILLPNYSDGSYRKAVGDWFVVPSVLLAFGQIFIAGFFLHVCAMAITGKSDFLKSMAITGMMTFLFSLTYVMFPFYGPFYYIVFAVTGPWYVLPLEIAYTTAMILISSYVIRKTYGMDIKSSIFVAMVLLLGITVAAS